MDQRTYNQYCATARTLDIVGERWTLLLVRELLTGPKRFVDLQQSLPGLGTGLLAARLKHLVREGLVDKVTLPPPARVAAYGLTEAGEELEPAVLALARWGLRWAMGPRRDGETFLPGWAVLGVKALFDADAAAGVHGVYEFRVGRDVFHVRVDDGAIDTVLGPAEGPDVTVEANDDFFVAMTERPLTLMEAIDRGNATVSGDRRALEQLSALIRPPEPSTRREPEQETA